MSDDVGEHIQNLYDEIHALKGIIERLHRPGTVTDVDYSDATKPRVRLQIGTDSSGNAVKGPWLPVASHAGDRTIHAPVTVGQQMLQISPDGNFEQGLLVHYGFSQQVQSPSTDPAAHVDVFGQVNRTLKNDSLTHTVGNNSKVFDTNGYTFTFGSVTFKFSSSGLAVQGGSITHNGLHVDASHVHKGVQPGNANTDVPAN